MKFRKYALIVAIYSSTALCSREAAFADEKLLASSATPGSSQCELHIWPTKTYSSTEYKMNSNGLINGYLRFTFIDSPDYKFQKKLEEGIGVDDQIKIIGSSEMARAKFAGYKFIFHSPPIEPAFNILRNVNGSLKVQKNGFAVGNRKSNSISTCYDELHVVLVGLFRGGGSLFHFQNLQTGIVWRKFGSSPTTIFVEQWIGNKSVPQTYFNNNPNTSDDIATLSDGFRKNIDLFLKRDSVTP